MRLLLVMMMMMMMLTRCRSRWHSLHPRAAGE
jgi:hypothetical protein